MPDAKRQLGAVDLLAVGDDAGNGAEPAGNPHRLRVGEIGQRLDEQLWVELVGLAVNVEIGAGKAGRDQRCALGRDRHEQLVDEAVLRLAQGVRIEPRQLEKVGGVDAARVRRAQHEGRGLDLGRGHLVGRQQLRRDRGAVVQGHAFCTGFGLRWIRGRRISGRVFVLTFGVSSWPCSSRIRRPKAIDEGRAAANRLDHGGGGATLPLAHCANLPPICPSGGLRDATCIGGVCTTWTRPGTRLGTHLGTRQSTS